MRKPIANLSNLFIILSAIGFLVLCFILSFHQRPPSDDIGFINMAQQKSVWENLRTTYSIWSGRWTSISYYFFLVSLPDSFFQVQYVFFFYYATTLLLLIYAVNAIIRFGILYYFDVKLTTASSLTYSVLFGACFHFFTFEAIEAWWWPAASFSYLLGIVLMLVGTALIICNKNRWIELLFIALCFAYVGGCFEIYALVVTSLFVLILFYYLKKKEGSEILKKKYGLAFLIAFSCLSISMIICIAAPGNYARIVILDHMKGPQPHTINQLLSGFSDYMLQKKYILAFLLAMLWMLLGIKLREKSRKEITGKQVTKLLLIGAIPIVLSILICCLFQIFALKFIPVPAKGWTFTSFGISAFFCLLFLIGGYKVRFSALNSSVLKLVIPFCTAALLFASAYSQYKYASTYAKAYDQLLDQLLTAKKDNFKGTLLVFPLPDPGMLTTLFIGKKYVNEPLKEILDLDFEIELKK